MIEVKASGIRQRRDFIQHVIEPIKIRNTKATECFSTCLYYEPEFKKRFPSRDYQNRYLDSFYEITQYLLQNKFHLNIFCDEVMLSTASKLKFGSIYLVKDQVEFPFSQHLYRYYSVLLPKHETITAYHFRGMDNIIPTLEFQQVVNNFISAKYDLLHAPYTRARGMVYTPIRGSCSVANAGIKSLANYLSFNALKHPENEWPEGWHCDENYLTEWFNKIKFNLKLCTILDRTQAMDFYFDLHQIVNSGNIYMIQTLKNNKLISQ